MAIFSRQHPFRRQQHTQQHIPIPAYIFQEVFRENNTCTIGQNETGMANKHIDIHMPSNFLIFHFRFSWLYFPSGHQLCLYFPSQLLMKKGVTDKQTDRQTMQVYFVIKSSFSFFQISAEKISLPFPL